MAALRWSRNRPLMHVRLEYHETRHSCNHNEHPAHVNKHQPTTTTTLTEKHVMPNHNSQVWRLATELY